jgi:SPP1 family predicted phage head-tail adaptor
MRERIIIKSRTYSISNTGQRSLDQTTEILTCWADIYQRRTDIQDLTGNQNVLEGNWVFRIRNSEPTDLLTKSNFITWRNKDYSIVSISAQESYQRIVELVCNVIE